MTSVKLMNHTALPAPAILSVSQSKSHVLAGVQDAYWSDEEEDAECPLCLEEMDVSDLNFKPCVCGYQICRFCWHHIKENLNKRCPACRRIYTDDAVEFKPVATQDHKRLTQQKKQRDREKKELESLGRKHLANVRVVQRSVVYVIGIGPRFAKEELIPTLRSNEYFGQYGKISKILIVKRTPPGGNGPVVGLYITYIRREDAARAIAAVDGAPSPGGGRDVMRASYGTTKYCMAFLRNVTCNDNNCMNLHEWGDEKDCFTKEDLTTLKHTMKTTETRAKVAAASSKKDDDSSASLPRAASWGQRNSSLSSSPMISHAITVTTTVPRGARRTAANRQPRHVASSSQASRSITETKKLVPVPIPSSRPSTPANVPAAPPPSIPSVTEVKTVRQKKEVALIRETASPAPSIATDSDVGSAQPELQSLEPSRPPSTSSAESASQGVPPIPVIPSAPPGLSAPPGISSPSRPPRNATDSPQTPLLASQSSYQMSKNAKELIETMQNRRESTTTIISGISPFPDIDRTLESLKENDGGFSFNLDPKLADEGGSTSAMADFEVEASTPFHGTYLQAFPALQSASAVSTPPGLGYSGSMNRSIYNPIPSRALRTSPLSSSNYMGSFNPFSDGSEEQNTGMSTQSETDEERKVSRFGFARGRHGVSSATSSPALNGINSPHLSQATGHLPPGIDDLSLLEPHSRWVNPPPHTYGLQHRPSQMEPSNIPAQNVNPSSRFQPFDGELGEAQLREFIQASRERDLQKAAFANHPGFKSHQPFSDPAIMSASFGPPPDAMFPSMSYGPPPGLSIPSAIPPGLHLQSSGMLTGSDSTDSPLPSSPVPSLSAVDFPALVSNASKEEQSSVVATASLVQTLQSKPQEKVSRKAAKKASTADKQPDKLKHPREKTTGVGGSGQLSGGRTPDKVLSTDKAPPSKPRSPTIPSSVPEIKFELAVVPDTKVVASSTAGKAPKVEEKVTKKAKEKTRTKAFTDLPKSTKPAETTSQPSKQPIPSTKQQLLELNTEVQVPLLSKKPKKSKPNTRVPKPIRDDIPYEEGPSGTTGGDLNYSPSLTQPPKAEGHSPSKSPDTDTLHRISLEELLEQITQLHPPMDLANHPFFDVQRLGSIANMPLEYGPLVHALSALSVGGGSFANNVPSGSIDTAVTSFQQLLETLTQTISDLLRLLPRTTWDDSSSFDGVLRDMLKGDDFLDEAGLGDVGQERDDEVAALTLALERRARWMEVQLSKLEELHRDINTAAVRAVLSFNDSGWDKEGFLPRSGDSLRKFDDIGYTVDSESYRPMTADELERRLLVAREAATFAEVEVRESMNKLQFVKAFDNDFLR